MPVPAAAALRPCAATMLSVAGPWPDRFPVVTRTVRGPGSAPGATRTASRNCPPPAAWGAPRISMPSPNEKTARGFRLLPEISSS
jgi:hypothetical protein